MTASRGFTVHHLSAADLDLMAGMLDMFGGTFGDADTYGRARPGARYTRRLLDSDSFIALVALQDDVVVGGLAAYELQKYEQERSEIYIYDLAVSSPYRRRGIATALITELQAIAATRAAWVIFVQADCCDDPAISLYTRLGTREDVLHFDIPVRVN